MYLCAILVSVVAVCDEERLLYFESVVLSSDACPGTH